MHWIGPEVHTRSPQSFSGGGAQRHTASMESSLNLKLAHLATAHVLNALRHQWNPHGSASSCAALTVACSTPYGINGILTRVGREREERHTDRAQRLTASMETSPGTTRRVTSPVGVGWHVLNALRHQWNPHTVEPPQLMPSGLVLNALRHQWNPHRLHGIAMLVLPRCSTPYGIDGILTGDGLIGGGEDRCSTPYGINGILTPVLLTLSHIFAHALRHQWNPH